MNLQTVNLTIHLLAAFMWIGGMMFLSAVAVPALRKVEAPERARVFSLIGRQFRIVGWISIAVLIITGVLNLSYLGIGLDELTSTAFWSGRFGRQLAIKTGLIAAMLALSALHDFVLGPRAAARPVVGTQQKRAIMGRRLVSWFARINLVLGLLVIAVAVDLGP